jgi:hypothetical protein
VHNRLSPLRWQPEIASIAKLVVAVYKSEITNPKVEVALILKGEGF